MLAKELKHISIKELLDKQEISVRAFNCCSTLKIESVYDIIAVFIDMPDNQRVKNAGKKTKQELHDVATKYAKLIEKSENNDKQLEKIVTGCLEGMSNGEMSVLRATAQLIYDWEADVRIKLKNIGDFFLTNNDYITFYTTKGHFPMFQLLDSYLRNSNNRLYNIYCEANYVYDSIDVKDRRKLGDKYGCTFERIRQIVEQINKQFFDREIGSKDIVISNILHNNRDWSYLYDIICNENYITFDSDIITEIRRNENVDFSCKFILVVIALLFNESFAIIGNDSLSNAKPIFLVSTIVNDSFDIPNFISSFREMLDNNEQETEFDLRESLHQCDCWINGYDWDNAEIVLDVIRNILSDEFELFPGESLNSFILPAKKKRSEMDVIYDILVSKGTPMHIDEIFAEFKNQLPYHRYTESSQIRPYLSKDERITYRNRNSVYTLKDGDYKTGTIKNAIIEYLSESDLPRRFDDVFAYVKRDFESTNVASVRSSMKADTFDRFVFFENGLCGLRTKQYPSSYIEEVQDFRNPKRSCSEWLDDIGDFIIENDHFPFCSSEDENEMRLGRWWQVKHKDSSLSEEDKGLIQEFIENYADYPKDKTEYDWHVNYGNLKKYIRVYGKLPEASNSLYKWFQRNQRKFCDNSLTEIQRKKFKDLLEDL